jgi:hypothetical protein
VSDANGSYTVNGVPEGTYQLRVPVTIRATGVEPVDVRLEPSR